MVPMTFLSCKSSKSTHFCVLNYLYIIKKLLVVARKVLLLGSASTGGYSGKCLHFGSFEIRQHFGTVIANKSKWTLGIDEIYLFNKKYLILNIFSNFKFWIALP